MNLSLFRQPFALPLFITACIALILVVSGAYRFHQHYQQQLHFIDQRLKGTAHAVQPLLHSLHSRQLQNHSLPLAREKQIARTLSQIARQNNLVYLYSLVLDKNNIARFTTSSETPQEIAGESYQTVFWSDYSEAPAALREAFNSGETRYAQYQDRWGSQRSVFVPFLSDDGTPYVIGADVNLEQLQLIEKNILLRELAFLAVLVCLLAAWTYAYIFQAKKLHKLNQQIENALAAAKIVAWERELENSHFRIYGTAHGLFGYPLEELPTTLDQFVDLTHPDDQHLAEKLIEQEHIASDDFKHAQLRIKNKQGHYEWASLKSREFSRGGKRIRTGIVENINDETLTRLSLHQSQRELSQNLLFVNALLSSTSDMVCMKDAQGIYRICNRPFEKMFGISTNEILGKSDFDLLPMHIANNLKLNDEKASASNEPLRVKEWLSFTGEARPRLIETLKSRVLDEEGKVAGVISVGRDITEWQDTIDALRKFKRFAEQSEQGLAISKISGDMNYINPELQKMVPALRTTAACHISDIYPAALQQRLEQEILPRTLNTGSWSGELFLEPELNQFMPVLSAFFVIRNSHDVPLYVGNIIQDISARKEFETELEMARQVAEQANQSKSAFLANMSHEIRTPLNAILGYAQLLTQENIEPQHKQQISQIYKSGQRLLHLINEILDLSKIEAGRMTVRESIFNLSSELHDLIALMRDKARRKGLSLELDYRLPTPCYVTTDQQKFGQIFLNLLSNAVKFTPRGSVTLRADTSASGVELAVIDTGAGISEDDIRTLFQPFTQGESGRQFGQGTGLGLALCRRLCELLGGSMSISSSPGEGTRVTVNLPLSELPLNEQPFEETARSTRAGLKLAAGVSARAVVVDDDDDSRTILGKYLDSIGLQTRLFDNATEALAYLQQGGTDIVFTDIRMPVLSGQELLQQVRQNPDLAKMPVVAVSASTMDQQRARFINSGFNAFVGKPVQFPDVDQCLLSLLDLATRREHPTPPAQAPAAEHSAREGADAKQLPLLQRLEEAAMDGDISLCSQLVKQLQTTGFNTGKLKAALQDYDLEAVERLSKAWLES